MGMVCRDVARSGGGAMPYVEEGTQRYSVGQKVYT